MKPTNPITDRKFKYVPACKTDIRVLFDRVRKELKTNPPRPNVVAILRQESKK